VESVDGGCHAPTRDDPGAVAGDRLGARRVRARHRHGLPGSRTYYAIALSVVGLDFGLTIGITAGLVSFIPYIGRSSDSWPRRRGSLPVLPDWVRVVIVLLVFFGGQVLNDYVLIPRLVGERVGLHPLWVMFGLFAAAHCSGSSVC